MNSYHRQLFKMERKERWTEEENRGKQRIEDKLSILSKESKAMLNLWMEIISSRADIAVHIANLNELLSQNHFEGKDELVEIYKNSVKDAEERREMLYNTAHRIIMEHNHLRIDIESAQKSINNSNDPDEVATLSQYCSHMVNEAEDQEILHQSIVNSI